MKKIIKTKGTPYEQNGKDLAIIDTFFKTKKPIMVGSKELKLAWENREQELEEPLSVKTEMDGYGEDMFNADGSLNPDKFIIKKGIGDLTSFYEGYTGALKGLHIEDISEITNLNRCFYGFKNASSTLTFENLTFDNLESLDYFLTNAKTNGIIIKNCSFPKVKRLYNTFSTAYNGSSKITIENLSFPELEEATYIFDSYTTINNGTIDLSEIHMPKIKKLSSLFRSMDDHITGFNSLNDTTLETLDNIFMYFEGTVDFTGWDTSKVKNFTSTFNGAKTITAAQALSISYASAEDLTNCFYNFYDLKNLDLTKLKIPKAKNISGMFGGRSDITSLDYSKLELPDTLEKAEELFIYLSGLTSFNLGQLKDMPLTSIKGWFKGCKALTSINIRDINISELKSMESLFEECTNLEMVYLPNAFSQPNKVESLKKMFYNCAKFPIGDLSSFDLANITDISYMFYGCEAITDINLNCNFTTKLTNVAYLAKGTGITTLDVTPIFNIDRTREWSLAGICSSCTSLTNVILPSEPYKLKSISSMFYGCTSIENIDLSNADTIGIVSYAFQGCSSLKNIIFPSKEITLSDNSLYFMFSGCSSLTSIDLSCFRFTENPTDTPRLTYAFQKCTALTSIKFPKGIYKTTIRQDLDDVLSDCPNLEEADLSFVYAPTYRTARIMANCTKLKKFIMPNVTRAEDSSSMYVSDSTKGCTSLELIDIRNLVLTTSEADSFFSADVPTTCKIIVATQEVKNYLINTKGFTNVFTKGEVE
jgi:hypothetical protein